MMYDLACVSAVPLTRFAAMDIAINLNIEPESKCRADHGTAFTLSRKFFHDLIGAKDVLSTIL